MPSYVEANLMSGERVVHRARLHWGIFVGPAIFFFIGLIIAIVAGAAIGGGGGAFAALVILVLFAIPIVRALIRYITTEFAVTSRRVVVKWGFIRRETRELNHRQVEGLAVSQGLIDRLFNAGTITVNGTGGRPYKVVFVYGPMEFRRNALETIDNSQ
jgi:uncharacterized membrane protein YdbT with pleckstrin-like domain